MADRGRSDEDSASNVGGAAGDLLSRVKVGTRLSIFWPDDDAYYQGIVAKHQPEYGGDGRRHVVTIHYDDGYVETVNLAAEEFRIVSEEEGDAGESAAKKNPPTASSDGDDAGGPSLEAPCPRGDRNPQEGPPEAFVIHDHEIYWGDRRPGPRGWRLYFPDRDRVTFYSSSFRNGRCEVEWEGEGLIYNTIFRKAGKRKRKKVDRAAVLECLQSPSRKAKRPPRKMVSVDEGDFDLALDPKPSKPHYITERLGMTQKEVISSLSKEMVNSFCDCCWVPWKGVQRPVLVLSPSDISGEGGMAEEWTKAYLTCQKGGNLSKIPHLVYWYETGWSTSKCSKSFSLVKKASISSYETGISQGWDRPSFIDMIDGLTEYEESILSGIKQMMKDHNLPKNQRGGPMFFPELRENERTAADKVVKELEHQYSSWESSINYKACISQGISCRAHSSTASVGELTSLELCAGEGRMSQALATHGFAAVTLDNDPKRSATSQLSLEELDNAIVTGQIQHYQDLNKPFSAIWAGPECRTWSRAQNGRYRNMDFIEGRGNRVLDVEAQQAKRDIESLVNILTFYKSRNPALVITIENPVGYLQHHPVSGLFGDILGLKLVKISYCQFSRGDKIYPQKDTHLWTNSGMLLHVFGSGEFECTPDKECIGRIAGGTHQSRTQDLPGKCAAYPSEMCNFIAPLLFAEALKGTFGVGTGSKDMVRRDDASFASFVH